MRFEKHDGDSDCDNFIENELNEEQIKISNHVCWLNIRKNLKNKRWYGDQTDMVMKILERREQLPEISSFAIKVSLKDLQDKNRINELIETLV